MANPLERMRQVEVFKLDYCPLCGCVLFRPQGMLEPEVYCYHPGCSYRFQAKELRGKVITHQRVTVPKKRKYTGKTENQKKAQGPTMVINCDNCGETEASYYTRQLRSADEGQTIFYKCLKCGYRRQTFPGSSDGYQVFGVTIGCVMHWWNDQARREEFRAPGQRTILGP